MSEEAKCRVHEIVAAARARGDNKPAQASAILAVCAANKKMAELAMRAAKECGNPLKELVILLHIDKHNEFFATALSALMGEFGADYSTMQPVIDMIDTAADQDLADIASGKIDGEALLAEYKQKNG